MSSSNCDALQIELKLPLAARLLLYRTLTLHDGTGIGLQNTSFLYQLWGKKEALSRLLA
jgi:hypothetical protein